MAKKYAFWNNKGGTGKTSIAFQAITLYAEQHPEQRILAIDVCPQANLSELMLGGLNNRGSDKLLARQGLMPRCSVGGYFSCDCPRHIPFQYFLRAILLLVPTMKINRFRQTSTWFAEIPSLSCRQMQ